MKTSLTHLPSTKQQELHEIVELICGRPQVKMLILFGSYARGDWVEELHEDDVHFVYQSDFDLLAVVETRSTSEQTRLEREIEKEIDTLTGIHTPVSVIVHDLEFINRRLTRAQYFFSDIKKEGVLLYGDVTLLIEPRELNNRERYHLAKEDFGYWLDKGKKFTVLAQLSLEKKYYPEAAFLLHQATEKLYSTILLVFTRYKPNTHNLETLRKLVNALDSRFSRMFPLNNDL